MRRMQEAEKVDDKEEEREKMARNRKRMTEGRSGGREQEGEAKTEKEDLTKRGEDEKGKMRRARSGRTTMIGEVAREGQRGVQPR